jgi:BlaI family transcriptional regulator, penicillinase repressor
VAGQAEQGTGKMHLTENEWFLMNVVWKKYPLTAQQVYELVVEATAWTEQTVKGQLNRLVEKGALTHTKKGREYLFVPKVTRLDAGRSALKSPMDRAFENTFVPLLRFLLDGDYLPPEQREQFEQLLGEE